MIELRAGSATATIDPVRGGRLASLSVEGRELIVAPRDDDDRSIYWGSFLMAPWAGRIEGGTFDWDGSRIELPRNEEGHAIHGLVTDRAWTVESVDTRSATVQCAFDREVWPFGGAVWQTFDLSKDRLSMTAEVRADRLMPAALGWHPWFRRGETDPGVTVDGGEVLETRDLIPTGRRLPVDDQTDLRSGPAVCERLLDHVYPDAASPVTVRWPGFELAVEFGPPLSAVVVHSREHAFCVEPQTAWPNAVVLEAAGIDGTGLVKLGAGERLRASMSLRWA